MLDSVRFRLTLWYVSVVAVVLVGFSVGVYWLVSRALHARIDEALRDTVEITATSLAHDAAEGQDPEDAARSTVAELSQGQQRIAIYDGAGRLLARRATRHPVDARLSGLAELPLGAPLFSTVAEEDGDDDLHRVAGRRVNLPDGTPFVIVASQELDDRRDRRPVASSSRVRRRAFVVRA